MIDGAGATKIDSDWLVADAPALSTTLIVKLDGPGVVGVPLITPVIESRLSPAGREPVSGNPTNHVNGTVPPLVAIGREYTAFAVPPGSEVVVIVNTPPMVIESALLVAAPTLSTTRMVKLAVAATVDVPEISPVLVFRLNPSGKVPADTDHVSGRVPPVAASV
jgi:hypothetical protein